MDFDRSLHLPHSPNARDLGGYRTHDGRWVRTRRLLRSGRLDDLSDVELGQLAETGVGSVFDLRSTAEREAFPDRIPEGVAHRWYDILGVTTMLRRAAQRDLPPDRLVTVAYRAMVLDDACVTMLGRAFRDIVETVGAADERALLVHCTGGKDRTGWVSALLLTILGVSRDDVIADYLLTNEFHQVPDHDRGTQIDVARGVRRAWIESAFDATQEAYGGVDGFIRDGLGLDTDDAELLRGRLLVAEPVPVRG